MNDEIWVVVVESLVTYDWWKGNPHNRRGLILKVVEETTWRDVSAYRVLLPDGDVGIVLKSEVEVISPDFDYTDFRELSNQVIRLYEKYKEQM